MFGNAVPKQGRDLTTYMTPSWLKGSLLNVDHSPVLKPSERWNKPELLTQCKMGLQMYTSSHSLRALLLFDTNYNVCFVLHSTLRAHTSVHRCVHTDTASSGKQIHTQVLKHTFIHTSGSTAKLMNLSKPQFIENRAIP